jgi:hypothetical protein
MTAIGLVMIGWIGWGIFRSRILPVRFEEVKAGDSQEQVVRLMGKPGRIERCGEPFGTSREPSGCAEDYLYTSPFAPLIPEYWSVSFDRERHVIGKMHHVSP